jgi:hypothetical protein
MAKYKNPQSKLYQDIKLRDIWQHKKDNSWKEVIADIYEYGGFATWSIGGHWSGRSYKNFIKEFTNTGEKYEGIIP